MINVPLFKNLCSQTTPPSKKNKNKSRVECTAPVETSQLLEELRGKQEKTRLKSFI